MVMKKKAGAESSNAVESLDSKNFKDNGFIEGDVSFGKSLATFDFNVQSTPQTSGTFTFNDNNKIVKSSLNGLTPPIDGEYFTIKRSYQLRPSTLRKLNEIRANHSDVNVYLNTLLDEAILHYYHHIFSEKLSS